MVFMAGRHYYRISEVGGSSTAACTVYTIMPAVRLEHGLPITGVHSLNNDQVERPENVIILITLLFFVIFNRFVGQFLAFLLCCVPSKPTLSVIL
jgi:hypothetical protein